VSFPARLLAGPTIDLADSTQGDVVALRRALADPDASVMGVRGGYAGRRWYAVRSQPNLTMFLTHLRAMSYAAIAFNHQQGKWTLGASSGCVPNRVFANQSLGMITSAAPSPTSNRILLIGVLPRGPCGTSETAAQFHVTYGPRWIGLIATYPPPPPGPHECPLHAIPPFALELDQPIGNRTIYDDGFLRPRLITQRPWTDQTPPATIPKTPVR
jgi:hypothetical protein